MIVIRGMEKIEDGFLKIMHVRTGDQLADGLTRRFILLLFEICWARWVLITIYVDWFKAILHSNL